MRPNNVNSIPVKTAATTNGPAIRATNLFAGSAVAISTGTVVGVLKVQASNDSDALLDGTGAPVNWVDVANLTVNVTTGGGVFLIPKFDVCYEWIRVVYTHTSGTGTINCYVKTLGQ